MDIFTTTVRFLLNYSNLPNIFWNLFNNLTCGLKEISLWVFFGFVLVHCSFDLSKVLMWRRSKWRCFSRAFRHSTFTFSFNFPVSASESREAGLDQGHGEVHLALGRGRRGRGEVREDGVQCGQTAQGRPPSPGDQMPSNGAILILKCTSFSILFLKWNFSWS